MLSDHVGQSSSFRAGRFESATFGPVDQLGDPSECLQPDQSAQLGSIGLCYLGCRFGRVALVASVGLAGSDWSAHPDRFVSV